MTLRSVLSHWKSDPSIAPNIAAWKEIPARDANFTPFPDILDQRLVDRLQEKGIHQLYSHQSLAWEKSTAGDHILLATGTASGKSLAYNLPVLDALSKFPGLRALYIFPTKALGHDQLETLHSLVSFPVNTYDGDTPGHARKSIREDSRIIITNPDMLHMGILPHHPQWETFFSALQFVVIDEIHIYRGVFGSHVANILRRFKRICRNYKRNPQFLLSSATIGNPRELGQSLLEEPVHVIHEDGSARGKKHFLLYNPPVLDDMLGLRVGVQTESVRVTNELLAHDIQTILFGRSRRGVEWMLQNLRAADPSRTKIVRAYRSGYLPKKRRTIEKDLRSGKIRVVIATTALELGVDIGGMDAAILAGYPGTIAGTWQQAGRSGRGKSDSLSMLVASASPLDQFLILHPDYFFDRTPEQALIDPNNLLILLDHIRCAAYELPFQINEGYGSLSSEVTQEFLDIILNSGELYKNKKTYYWMSEAYPASDLSLRTIPGKQIQLRARKGSGASTIGVIDSNSAHWMVHPGAIYLHEGAIYLVEKLDLQDGTALMQESPGEYYTEARKDTEVNCRSVHRSSPVTGAVVTYGDLVVTSQVVGYHKFNWDTHQKLSFHELDLPPTELHTQGYWFALSQSSLAELEKQGTFISGSRAYGPSWGKSRDAARSRDHYRCQVCGAAEADQQHHVHHKTPFKLIEDPETANRLENLITLCPRCHLRVENVVRIRSGLSGVAYALSHLAPLLLMCDRYDLGLHTDPNSPLGDGHPTIVLYEEIPAGVGFSKRLYELHNILIQQAFELVSSCACRSGCPSCVGPGGEAGSGGKPEALSILTLLLRK
jgi:DEAD/DEAH box helicase domain-containing protein